jgi:GNAT superfamily N-acetyltransferase
MGHTEPVIIHYLEMTDRSELVPHSGPARLDVRECVHPLWQFNRFLYELVGAPWAWHDKLSWTDRQWRDYAEDPMLSTHVAYVDGTPAGYFELLEQDEKVVELAYFGLVERFIGQGYGGELLSRAIETAWGRGANRLWCHTCTLDHPHALDNYLARGMRLTRSEPASR